MNDEGAEARLAEAKESTVRAAAANKGGGSEGRRGGGEARAAAGMAASAWRPARHAARALFCRVRASRDATLPCSCDDYGI